nr:sporulation protein YunB [Neobacillus sp. Marseille-Q6967]
MVKFRRRITRRRGPLPFRQVLFLSFIFFLLSTVLGIWLVNKGIEPSLIRYAESKTKQIASQVINKAINKKTVDVGDVIKVESGENGAQPTAGLNTEVINQKLSEITNEVQNNLNAAEKGDLASLEQLTDVDIQVDAKREDGIVWNVPLGQATNMALLGNLGPKIPVRFHAIGEVRPDVKINTKPMGINNTWIDVAIHLEVSVQIITPFATKITKLDQNIPVGGKLIQGDVPQFYNNGGSMPLPAIQLPDSEEKKEKTKK